MKDLAVVSSCSGYGRYLREWATSIAAQTSKPGEVALVIHGNAQDAEHVPGVRTILERAGIPFAVAVVRERLDFGEARNRAVRMTLAPWVMHFDADDVLKPWALEDAAALAPNADVISFGYERFGEALYASRKSRRLYRTLTGPEALIAVAPCSGLSPFRRTFFDRSPYRLGMLGAWDTALWIGFARLGARFVPTTRPAFGYRQHSDSVFNRRRTTFDLTHFLVTNELHGLRRHWEGVTVVIPYRPDHGPRDRSLAFVRAWYARHFPEWEVITGSDHGAAWCKGEATRDALKTARGRILVIADADCLVDPAALREAVGLVERNVAPWAIPHGEVHRLNERETTAWIADGVDREVRPPGKSGVLIRRPYTGYQGGGFIVVRRDRWNAVGGFPLEFKGWGCEDEAVAIVLDTLLGEPARLGADLVHLWHPPGDRTKSREYAANRLRFRPYQVARGNRVAMFDLVNPRLPKNVSRDSNGNGPAIERPVGSKRLYSSDVSGPGKSRTIARTIEIRREQANRNAEQTRLSDAALEAARARRLARGQNGATPQR